MQLRRSLLEIPGNVVQETRTNGILSGMTVGVAGYTDSTGDARYNQALSLQRAAAVRAALLREGVAPGRVEFAGYGDASPVASNDTREGRASNRRVEIELRSSGVGAYR